MPAMSNARMAKGVDGDKCANNGCDNVGEKSCSRCKQVKYCSAECQRVHWKKGGHKSVCAAKVSPGDRVKVVGLVGTAALNGRLGTVQPRNTWKKGDPAMWTVDRITVRLDGEPPKDVSLVPSNIIVLSAAPRDAGVPATSGSAAGDDACTICLESDPTPVQKGCACRGDAGLAHLDCLIQAASHKQESSGSAEGWTECMTCNHLFNGSIAAGLAAEFKRRSEGHPEKWVEFITAAHASSRTMLMAGNPLGAEAVCRKTLASLKRMPRVDDFSANVIRKNLAAALDEQGKHKDAQAIFERVFADFKREFGPDRESTLECAMEVACNLEYQGKFDDAVAIYKDCLERATRTCGATGQTTVMCGVALAGVFTRQRKIFEAYELFKKYMPNFMRVLGPDHPSVLSSRVNYGNVLAGLSQMAEAEVEFSEALASQTRSLGPHHPMTVNTAQALATCRAVRAQMGQ